MIECCAEIECTHVAVFVQTLLCANFVQIERKTGLAMRVTHYLLYVLHFVRAGAKRRYYGITGVFAGQSDWQALEARKKNHKDKPVAWVKGCDESSLTISMLKTGLCVADALADEAKLTSQGYLKHGYHIVRGGPWCRKLLPYDDMHEIHAVDACTSRKAIMELRQFYPGGSLDLHLSGASYAKPAPTPAALHTDIAGPGFKALSLAAVPNRHRVAIAFVPRKRPSGKSGHAYRQSQNMW